MDFLGYDFSDKKASVYWQDEGSSAPDQALSGTGIVTECHDYWKMKHTSSQLTLDIQAYTD